MDFLNEIQVYAAGEMAVHEVKLCLLGVSNTCTFMFVIYLALMYVAKPVLNQSVVFKLFSPIHVLNN